MNKQKYGRQTLIVADAHVHIYRCFELLKLFNSAFNNFEIAAREIDRHISYSAILFLTETKQDKYFNYLTNLAKKNSQLLQGLTIETTQEDCSIVIHDNKGRSLYLIAGRQIVTAENLEVLALITNKKIEDSKPIETVIKEIIEKGGIPVIPWGVGKWIGRRGAILEKLLKTHDFPYLFLGDNSGRPNFWSKSPYFQLAQQQNMRILPGSDPLPFSSECCRTGRFGFAVNGTVASEAPAQSIKQILLDSTLKPKHYGSLETPLRFIQNQIAMQILKLQRGKR